MSQGREATAQAVATAIGGIVHGREGRVDQSVYTFPDALAHIRDLFAAGVPVVGVCASGILIRAVAPLLSDKRSEPPVVSVSEDGRMVVPLLGGHRGANRLATRIAEALGGTAALTTAGEVSLGLALDEPPEGWVLENPDNAKAAMAGVLASGGAHVDGDEAAKAGWLADLPSVEGVDLICTTEPWSVSKPTTLVFRPQRAALGVGCSRDCPADELIALVDGLLAEAELAPKALKGIYTLDLKGDEPAMLALARHLDLPLRLFTADELEAETPRLETPSEVVFAEVGCHGVSEAAALAGAGPDAILGHPKIKTAHATAALAMAPQPITELRGRSRGRLSIVGIGPGQASWRTPEVSQLVAAAEELVGYSLYLDLLGPLAAGKPRADFPLGGEEDRCRYALERAAEGREVALVCSGDAGIYAMAALVFELLDRAPDKGGVSRAARPVEIVCSPGVSALQGAAARAGAPLGHDFCTISLSDLLTPRDDILRRVRAAAEGDFVIAFYNPVSRTRRTLLAEARDILAGARPGAPVMLASNLGRPKEAVRYLRIEELQVDDVDMLTVVLVGSSASRLIRLPDGDRIYTPRGYAKKLATGEAGT
nr:precorrin-3B C(17)-methyltransferase [Frigidibacter sp. ROC022]